jgi:anthranilate synthase component 2
MKNKILIIDNYDSFTYNLAHQVHKITDNFPAVFRNDEISISAIEDYDLIILSPGPGLPSEAGILKKVIDSYAEKKPILGICLGLQAVAEVFGGKLKNLSSVYHGVSSVVSITAPKAVIYKNFPKQFEAGRYHSWVCSNEQFPDELRVTGLDPLGNIMSLEHKFLKISAVQFHPESILTPLGTQLVKNFIDEYI